MAPALNRSVEAFLAGFDPNQPCCIVIDVRMPVISGLDPHEIILERKITWPVIFVTTNGTRSIGLNFETIFNNSEQCAIIYNAHSPGR